MTCSQSTFRALLTSELETIFASAPLAPNSVAHQRVREAYAQATGKAPATTQGASTKKRIPGPDDDCPICYDGMHGVNEKSLVFCEDCGNALHKECFQQCQSRLVFVRVFEFLILFTGQANSAKNGQPLTCVWCRARWISPAAAAGTKNGAQRTNEGYLNLAGVSGVSPVRDTSSCE